MSATSLELKVPAVGESITEVEVGDWLKQEGDPIAPDEPVVVLETDKATVEIPSPIAGRLTQILKPKGQRVQVGDTLAQIETDGRTAPTHAAPQKPAQTKPSPTHKPTPARRPASGPSAPAAAPRVMPAAARLAAEKGVALDQVQATGPGGRVLKEDVARTAAESPETAPPTQPKPTPAPPEPDPAEADRAEETVPLTLLRRKIAERLVQAQHNAALLTTFNEIDMSAVQTLRREHQERFQERYQTKLGFMSFFVKAVVEALRETPQLNAELRGTDVVYRNYYDIGVAIGGGRGLVVPVLRHAERLSFAQVELAIADFARKAKENRLRPEDLVGGTFTITNGGVYGSLLSTPLINPPQSGVLGMHAIQDRPVALAGQVVIRPMMYIALTYDHRLVDGREAVTWLRHVKELVEQPARILLGI
ncbi:MAG: 2-oxoglutarate dehydrogenase complex dihydrolipoyllysine-residue succinyltransferase [Verrucomicrobia bacterium]|nr:2-oxoglutarate dehydrogenase complex dihydrolipoyllysine-residue succinyltransferase [Verrucomicrobiota bacterium]